MQNSGRHGSKPEISTGGRSERAIQSPEIDFGGPEPLTRNQAVEVAERATGRPFKVQHMPLLAVKVAARVLPRANDALASIFGTGLMQDLTPVTWDDSALTSRGISPRSATAWIEAQAGAGR